MPWWGWFLTGIGTGVLVVSIALAGLIGQGRR